MVFDRHAQFKYHIKHEKCKLFSEKFKLLGHTVLAASVGVFKAK